MKSKALKSLTSYNRLQPAFWRQASTWLPRSLVWPLASGCLRPRMPFPWPRPPRRIRPWPVAPSSRCNRSADDWRPPLWRHAGEVTGCWPHKCCSHAWIHCMLGTGLFYGHMKIVWNSVSSIHGFPDVCVYQVYNIYIYNCILYLNYMQRQYNWCNMAIVYCIVRV